METQITSGVEVGVETFYLSEDSDPLKGEYVYSYRITLTNRNSFPVQLLRRLWIITNCFRDVRTVEGAGVVGRQPLIYPGETYQYSSGCTIDAPIGKMEGIYIFTNKVERKEFEVTIPKFTLIAPEILN